MIFQGRQAIQIESDRLRVTVLREGGHIVEVMDKVTGVNPLWNPPWSSIEPSAYDRNRHPEYGVDNEAKLLSGIMGHNLCLDVFGPPSDDEYRAGVGVHGESSVVPYQIENTAHHLTAEADLPLANLRFRREIRLTDGSLTVAVQETVENLSATDRPIAWTQHVTIGPPFLQHGETRIRIPAAKSRTFESQFGASELKSAADFTWPLAPTEDGGTADLSLFGSRTPSAGYTAHLLDTGQGESRFLAYSPALQLGFGYRWQVADFPWIGLWEENQSRTTPPWLGRTVALGLEFGVSPFPETRRQMIERGTLFGMPAFRWLPAKSRVAVHYEIFVQHEEPSK